MNILFLTIGAFDSIEKHGLYPDLLRVFAREGHSLYIVSTRERRTGLPTELLEDASSQHLQVRIGNITRTNLLEKGLSTVTIGQCYQRAIQKYWCDVRFDLVLYPTPPITLAGVVAYIKRRDHARTYLLLKDIFPQNAVDIGILRKTGLKGLIYRYFRAKEKKLYALSDRIGCMSRANVDYLLVQDPEIDPAKVDICPNSVEPLERTVTPERRRALREKYGIPQDKTVFLYGGNLGRPQGVPFIMDCLRACRDRQDCFFLICGGGTEFPKLQAFAETERLPNVKVLPSLPHDDYEDMVPACDVGLLFLDCRFTIPNFPSRLLSYMQARLPVLCCTDPNTDVGDVCAGGGFGWKCLSSDVSAFCTAVDSACAADRPTMGAKGYEYLLTHYTAEQGYRIIMKGLE